MNPRLVVFILLFFISTDSFSKHKAEARRRRNSHIHGNANLNFVAEGNKLFIELKMPANDAVGFEYAPKTLAQKKLVKESTLQLSTPSAVLKLPEIASCKVAKKPNVSNSLKEDNSHHPIHHHDHKSEGKSHAEFEAKYSFLCDKIDNLNSMKIIVFSKFPNLKEIKVQGVIGDLQISRKLTYKSSTIQFGK